MLVGAAVVVAADVAIIHLWLLGVAAHNSNVIKA